MMIPTELRDIIRSGLLSFPVTPFDAEDRFAPGPFRDHLEWLSAYPVAGLIVAGGTGELFSLMADEVIAVDPQDGSLNGFVRRSHRKDSRNL